MKLKEVLEGSGSLLELFCPPSPPFSLAQSLSSKILPATMDEGKVESGTAEVRLKSTLLLREGLNSEKRDDHKRVFQFARACFIPSI